MILPALPMISHWSNAPGETMTASPRQYDIDGVRPLNLLLPHPFTSVFGSLTKAPYHGFVEHWGGPGDWEATSYLGPVLILSLMYFAVHWRKWSDRPEITKNFADSNSVRPWFWLTVFAIFLILSMGTFLDLFGWRLPLPFDTLKNIFPFSKLRTVNRIFVFALLAATVVTGFVLTALIPRLKRKWLIYLSFPLFALLAAERLMLPFSLHQQTVSEFYHQIKTEPGDFAVADLPIWFPGYSEYNYYQITHGHPIVTGEYLWLTYRPEAFRLIRDNPLLQLAICPRNDDVTSMIVTSSDSRNSAAERLKAAIDNSLPVADGPTSADRDAALAELARNHVRYVIVHNLILHNDPTCLRTTAYIRGFFRGMPHVFADGEITVYSVPDLLPRKDASIDDGTTIPIQ